MTKLQEDTIIVEYCNYSVLGKYNLIHGTPYNIYI